MSIEAKQYRQAADVIDKAQRILVTSHIRPDGDAVGGVVAMRQVLRALGKEVVAVLLDAVPPRYSMLVEPEAVPVWPDDVGPHNVGQVDAIVIVDTCTYTQLEPMAEYLRASKAVKIAVDHHATREELADYYLVDEQAAAASVLVWQWCRQMDWPVDDLAADALFVGMSTDCGWFRFANTNAELLASCAELVSRGVRPDELHQKLYQAEPAGRLRLLGAMLETMELHADGRFACLALPAEAFRRCGATPMDTEDLINEPQRIGSVVVTALFVEEDDGRVRLSLRSKRDVDVAAIAQSFGGGGHTRAAGARASLPLDEFKRQITAAVLEALDS